MYEIVSDLYLSSYNDLKVTSNSFVVNCTKDLPMINGLNMRIAVDDDMSTTAINDMYLSFPNVVEKMHTHLEKGCQVIVHCRAGQQRSAAVIAAYLMAKHNYFLVDAIKYIRFKKRDAFFFNVNFQDSLVKYEKLLHN
jgi:protein-tyrosine phosphatase